MDWVDCPMCGPPAPVVDRYPRPSTDGPLAHVVTVCPRLHHLSTAEDSLEPRQVNADPAEQEQP